MQYRFAQDEDFSDYASGSVLRSAPGFPAFPVRLGSEIFSRALEILGSPDGVELWDPCCGSGYLATTLGLIHGARIRGVTCSDIDEDAVGLAVQNLALLSRDGLERRRLELVEQGRRLGRPAPAEAAAAAGRLARTTTDLPARAVRADALGEGLPQVFDDVRRPDLVITDVPYGQRTQWSGPQVPDAPVEALVRNVARATAPGALIVVIAQERKVDLGSVPALRRIKLGKRSVAFVEAAAAHTS